MLCASSLFGVVASAILLSTVTCDNGYIRRPGSFYKVHDTRHMTWDEAQSQCISEGAYLVVINDDHEAQIVKDLAFPMKSLEHRWIFVGVRDREENGNWQSVLGDPLDRIYHKWAFSGTTYHCGALKDDGLLDDMNCNYTFSFICEKKTNS